MQIPNKEYIITISYGNYIGSMGGTDKYISELQSQLKTFGISVVHIYPLKKKVSNRVISSSLMGIVIDRVFEGYYTMSSIINFIDEWESSHTLLNIFINHLKDCSIKRICYLLDHVIAPISFFIHDYYSICPTGGLIKNNEQFCGASFPNEGKCKNCKHFSKLTMRLVVRYKLFFDKYQERITFIAPSTSCGNIWGTAYVSFGNRVCVIPHQVLVDKYINNMELITNIEQLKIAFIGMPRALKGWNDWLNVSKKVGKNMQVRLFHFGGENQNIDNVTHIDVNFNLEKKSMVYQLRKEKIHCAVLWSKVPETYSYTYYEVFASNCFVITNMNSGNIADQVNKYKNGYVCTENEALEDIILDVDRLIFLINQFRSKKIYGPDFLQSNSDIIEIIKMSSLGEKIKVCKAPRINEFRLISKLVSRLYCIIKTI